MMLLHHYYDFYKRAIRHKIGESPDSLGDVFELIAHKIEVIYVVALWLITIRHLLIVPIGEQCKLFPGVFLNNEDYHFEILVRNGESISSLVIVDLTVRIKRFFGITIPALLLAAFKEPFNKVFMALWILFICGLHVWACRENNEHCDQLYCHLGEYLDQEQGGFSDWMFRFALVLKLIAVVVVAKAFDGGSDGDDAFQLVCVSMMFTFWEFSCMLLVMLCYILSDELSLVSFILAFGLVVILPYASCLVDLIW